MEKIKPTRLKDEEPAEEQKDAEQDPAAALPPTPLPSPVADGPTSAWDRVRPNLPGAVVSKRSGTLTPPRVTRGSSSGSLYSPRIKRNGSFRSLTSLRENTAAWSAQLHGIVNSIDAVWMQSQQRRGAKWVSADSEARALSSRRGPYAWQTKLLAFLHSPRLQALLTLLLVCDVIAVFGELFIDAEFPSCMYVLRDAIPCCDSGCIGAGDYSAAAAADAIQTILSLGKSVQGDLHLEHDETRAEICAGQGHSHLDSTGRIGCDSHKHDLAHKFHKFLFRVSLTVCQGCARERLPRLLDNALYQLFDEGARRV